MPHQHFKMEGLHFLNEVLLEGNSMCKLDLKDAYFCVPLNKKSRKYLEFLWSSNLYEFIRLYYGLGPASGVFTTLLSIPVGLFHQINCHV